MTSLAFLRSKHELASAVVLSCATLLKGPAVLLLAYFVIFRKDVKYLLHFLLSIVVILAVSLLVVPTTDYWWYLTQVVPTFASVINANSNQSIGGVVSIAHSNYVAPVASLGGFVLYLLFSYWAGGRRLPFSQEDLSSDSMFLMNVLVVLLFGPRSTIYPYVWVILPLALFLSGILIEPIKAGYLTLVGLGAFLLNSNLAPSILNYQVLPLEVVGNIMMCLCLVLLFTCPKAIIDCQSERLQEILTRTG
jgi:hypothetical protein